MSPSPITGGLLTFPISLPARVLVLTQFCPILGRVYLPGKKKQAGEIVFLLDFWCGCSEDVMTGATAAIL